VRNTILNDKKWKRVREPTGILLVPLHNLMVRGTVWEPRMLRSSYRYSWGKYQRYFYEDLQASQPPCHFYVEFLEDDYVFFSGIGRSQVSWFLYELAATGAIPHGRKDDILIVLNDDFREGVPDRRMLQGIANFLITPMMREYGMAVNRVRFFDDALAPNAAEKALENKNQLRRFILEESRYWDHHQMESHVKEYLKR